MKDIILLPNPSRDIGFAVTKQVCEILKKHGRNALVCPVFEDETEVGEMQGLPISDFYKALDSAEMIITFGGDGTILRAARLVADRPIPILGINMGGKGFMAELELEDVELVECAAKGEYEIGYRMMLDAELLRGGEVVAGDFALNDVVIRGINKVIEVTLYGDGNRISSFEGDGAVIATPTGSTAYSMSAGGPVVEPLAHNIIVTPICAHVLEAKPYVLMSDRNVTVEIGFSKSNPAYMSVDGCEPVPVFGGDEIRIKKSEKSTCFVRLSNKSFYRRVSEKLGEKV